jgi:hypothetical protein
MGLPVSREVTATPGAPFPSAAFNIAQDCIIGHKYGPTWFAVPLTPVLSTQVQWTPGYLFSNGTPNGAAVIPLQTQRNNRIYEWRFQRYNNSGAGNIIARLRKGVISGGLVVSSDVDSVTIVAPPATFQPTDRASATFTGTGGALDAVNADEIRWFEFTLPAFDMRISMLQVLMDAI